MRRLSMRGVGLAVWATLAMAATAVAEVTAVDARGFRSEHVLVLSASPEAAWLALTRDVHRWWDAAHSYSGDAANFTLDARPGGCFCEALPGGGVEHMRVAHAAPGVRLNLIGGLGPLQEMGVSGTMSFALAPVEGGTRLSYRYVVSGYHPDGLQPLAEPVDQVQLGQLRRLQAYLADR